jgi:hypothetical protein
MLKRDSLTVQMQQLSQVLAKVKRLIIEDNEPEATRIVVAKLLDYYPLHTNDLFILSDEEFIQLLKDRAFKPEEVNLLAYFIDEYAGLQEEFSNQILLYHKLIRIFDYLERELHFISFDHIARRSILEQQIKKQGD